MRTKLVSILISLPIIFIFLAMNAIAASLIRIAYERNTDNYVTNEWGNSVVNLTNTPGISEYSPQFSPDGSKIAYFSNASGRFELWTMDVDGANKRQVSGSQPYNASNQCSPWSPDGQWLYFGSAHPGDNEIWAVRIDGTGIQQLTDVPGLNTSQFDFSHDGTKLAYARGPEGNHFMNRLYMSNADFTNEVLLVNSESYNPKFSPDDSQIAYRCGAEEAHVINRDGTGDYVVASKAMITAWHPSGNKLLVLTWPGTSWGSDFNLYWMNADGSNPVFITQGGMASVHQDVDTTAPTISQCALPKTAVADPITGKALVPDFTAGLVATDNVGITAITQLPAAGTLVGVGVTSIAITVSDAAGNKSTCTTSFTVNDLTPPMITTSPSSLSLPSDGNCHAVLPDLAAKISATDNVTPAQELKFAQTPQAGTILNAGISNVTVAVQDKAGNVTSTNILANVSNSAPTVSVSGNLNVVEGAMVALSANGNDPEGGSINYLWDLDNDGIFEKRGQSITFGAIDGPESKVVAVMATDACGNSAVAKAAVLIANVVPTVGPITAPIDPALITAQVNVSVNFSDPGILDFHSASWNWGDRTSSSGTISETNGSGLARDSHVYAAAGVYRITVTVTDKDGGSGQSSFEYVVVYDPSAGFVTGGGWINSPVGAYTLNPSLTGKATFGFVSKYQKGANQPSGDTQFNFHVANMNFKSTSYDWLVIAGARAKYKGEGTINGTGSFAFMLTAIDGQENGGGGQDKFRMKIWDKSTNAIIYDNQIGAGDDSDAATVISGGSIVIHK